MGEERAAIQLSSSHFQQLSIRALVGQLAVEGDNLIQS